MINQATGEVLITSVPVSLGPNFTRRKFLSSPLANGSREMIRNEPYRSFNAGSHEISGTPFYIVLYFYRSSLESIDLSYSGDVGKYALPEPYEPEEQVVKRIHDQWLHQVLGPPPYSYDWGEVSSS